MKWTAWVVFELLGRCSRSLGRGHELWTTQTREGRNEAAGRCVCRAYMKFQLIHRANWAEPKGVIGVIPTAICPTDVLVRIAVVFCNHYNVEAII